MKTFSLILLLLIGFQTIAQEETFDEMVKTYYKNTVPLIYPNQLYKKMLSGEKMYILDTREGKEYEVSSIQNAIHVGFLGFNTRKVSDFDKNRTVIVYCTIGARSETVGEKLQKDGFKNVYNLYGGLIYWKNQGYKVYQQKEESNFVHVYSKKWGKWLTVGKPVY